MARFAIKFKEKLRIFITLLLSVEELLTKMYEGGGRGAESAPPPVQFQIINHDLKNDRLRIQDWCIDLDRQMLCRYSIKRFF